MKRKQQRVNRGVRGAERDAGDPGELPSLLASETSDVVGDVRGTGKRAEKIAQPLLYHQLTKVES